MDSVERDRGFMFLVSKQRYLISVLYFLLPMYMFVGVYAYTMLPRLIDRRWNRIDVPPSKAQC